VVEFACGQSVHVPLRLPLGPAPRAEREDARCGRADALCEEATSTPHAVAKAALAHAISDKVEAAYRRGDSFAKRRALVQEWAEFRAMARAEVRVSCRA
jgi:hypothetical protein